MRDQLLLLETKQDVLQRYNDRFSMTLFQYKPLDQVQANDHGITLRHSNGHSRWDNTK